MSTLRIKVIVGSTRANRFSEKPAEWIFDAARKREDLDVELLDLRDYPLPFFEEAMPPGMAKDGYTNPIVVKWRDKIREADGFIICTPEYNHGYPAVLKNALDYVYFAWSRKAVAFVSWGGAGGRGRRAAPGRRHRARHGADALRRAHSEPVVHQGRQRDRHRGESAEREGAARSPHLVGARAQGRARPSSPW